MLIISIYLLLQCLFIFSLLAFSQQFCNSVSHDWESKRTPATWQSSALPTRLSSLTVSLTLFSKAGFFYDFLLIQLYMLSINIRQLCVVLHFVVPAIYSPLYLSITLNVRLCLNCKEFQYIVQSPYIDIQIRSCNANVGRLLNVTSKFLLNLHMRLQIPARATRPKTNSDRART